MDVSNSKNLGIKYEAGSTDITVIAGDDTETIGPEKARDLVAQVEDDHRREMATTDSELAGFVADLEVAVERAERQQQDQQ